MNSMSFVLINMVINFALMLIFVRFMIQLAQIDTNMPIA